MNILGMGTLEILVILLLAFIFLGPSRMIDAARILGKASRELRRMADEFSSMHLPVEENRTGSARPDPDTPTWRSKGPYESGTDEESIAVQSPFSQNDDSERPRE